MPSPKIAPSPASESEEQGLLPTLRVFASHRIQNLRYTATSDNASADCPFCGKVGKFGIHVATTKFSCFSCGAAGNEYTFVREIWGASVEQTTDAELDALAVEWGLWSGQSLRDWGVVKHCLTQEWAICGYNDQRKVTGLYRWVNLKNAHGKWKRTLLPSPRLGHHLFGLGVHDPAKPAVFLCEGWRDGVAMYDTLRLLSDQGKNGLLSTVNVLAVPGTNSFKPEWVPLFSGKETTVMFDNDFPTINLKTGKEVVTGGPAGVRRVAGMLMSDPKLVPATLSYLSWGGTVEQGFNRKYANGTDVRDFLTGTTNA